MNRPEFSSNIIGILRGVDTHFFEEILDSSYSLGLPALEVTMNTEGVLAMIENNISNVPKGKMLGVGTVRNINEAKDAISAGAMFLVTPNFNSDVIAYANKHSIPVVSGALTPTEVYSAWEAGAAMVKVFPCAAMGGVSYIKSLLGPFDHIGIAAVGGVSLDNVNDYFRAGAKAVGVSSELFGKDSLTEKNIKKLINNVKHFIGSVSQ